jgi:phage terminase small subunit
LASRNDKQDAFVREYLVDLNATQAALRAGYSSSSAASQGARLLKNAKVRDAIDAAKRAQQERVEITADTVLRELLRIARVDVGEAFDNDTGALKPLKDMPEDVRRAISGVEVDELWGGGGRDRIEIGQTRKVKFWDKVKSLELLGKHLKMFVDKMEHSGTDGAPLQIIINRTVRQ